MTRSTWVHWQGEIVRKEDAIAQGYGQSARYVSGVHSDTMDATINHVDGKTYDSKSKFRAATKAHGYIEVGNEKLAPRKFGPPKLSKQERTQHIRQAIEQLRARG